MDNNELSQKLHQSQEQNNAFTNFVVEDFNKTQNEILYQTKLNNTIMLFLVAVLAGGTVLVVLNKIFKIAL